MSENKHTPGPWTAIEIHPDESNKVYSIRRWGIQHADGWVGEIYQAMRREGTMIRNLRDGDALLVAAAPELLAACKAALKVTWFHTAGHATDIEKLRKICLSYQKWNNDILLPAIAKAEGNGS